ncbi:hypothetical protein [Anaeromyxobacter oryzisoli]|uniref:hypothetical protein n=1 Tax=Anaeromyxobacter oryzisoli TaxID=2925408 RepID=UPI001F569D94|nr:hypothetical protein [Anaeromyxobacter sp. SG63]
MTVPALRSNGSAPRAARRSLPLLAAALAGLVGCRSAGPWPVVRVDAPAAAPGAPADAQALGIAQAVRTVAAEERLTCRAEGGAVLLVCTPGDVGSRLVQARLAVRRAGTGVEVIADAPFARPGDRDVCRLAGRLVRAIDAELGLPAARIHPGSGCASDGEP